MRKLALATQPSLELGMIGNGSISALIDERAAIVWCCWPRFDADPIFHTLLGKARDEHAHDGIFTIELEGCVRTEQRYDRGTAILRTRLFDAAGNAIEITDFAPRFVMRGRMFYPTQLVRRVKPIAGLPQIRVILRPRFDWGRKAPQLRRGSHHISYVGPEETLRLTTDAPLTYILNEHAFALHEPLNLILGPDETMDRGVANVASDFEEQTALYWRSFTRNLALPLEWQEAVIRSAICLKLCLYEDTGGIVAAMTTSIPEAPGTQRNWDYRFCWLRDAFFVVRALNSIAEVSTMESYLRWLYGAVRNGDPQRLQPLFGIGLETELAEHELTHLSGYRGMGPVRIGNQAHEHAQHDVYGNVVLAATQSFFDDRLTRRGDVAEFALLESIGERAWAVHDKPDAGMWELRTRARVHTSSVLMCWAACDRLAKIAINLGLQERSIYWQKRASEIKSSLLANSWSDKRNAFVESYGGNTLDASVLLMVEVGLIEPTDPRFIATVDALEKSLCDGPYMRRYEDADDFGMPETAFNICAFWRVDALARIGRRQQAREVFESLLASRNRLGLLSEDTHQSTGELWGNFPQTYSMVGLINGATRLSAPWDNVI